MNVHLDISQLIKDPRRSGIQRAERELIRHWPGPAKLVPCMFDGEQLRDLPSGVFDVICADAPPGGVPVERLRLERHIAPGSISSTERLICAELFLDPERSRFYADRAQRPGIYWLVYDFIPWLNPVWFGPGSIAPLMPFLRALRGVANLAFISERTRQDCERWITRRPMTGPVIPMGADGLGLERRHFDADHRSFVMLGTIEHRKNALPVLQAFDALWSEGLDAELVMIGSLAPEAIEEMTLMRRFTTVGRPFRHLRDLPDAGVREELRRARAMLFPSIGEGFGIPPMEALHAGIPVVVSSMLPAISGMEGLGQIRLDNVSPGTIAASVRRLADDVQAAQLWEDAARLHVPGWSDFARRMADWVQA